MEMRQGRQGASHRARDQEYRTSEFSPPEKGGSWGIDTPVPCLWWPAVLLGEGGIDSLALPGCAACWPSEPL